MRKESLSKRTEATNRIRIIWLNYKLHIAAGQADYGLTKAEYEKASYTPGKQRKAMDLLATMKIREKYINDLEAEFKKFMQSLDFILDVYPDSYKKIWFLYFIQRQSLGEISERTNYVKSTVQRAVAIMADDLKFMFADDERKTNDISSKQDQGLYSDEQFPSEGQGHEPEGKGASEPDALTPGQLGLLNSGADTAEHGRGDRREDGIEGASAAGLPQDREDNPGQDKERED